MAWKSLGREAVRKGTRSLEFEARVPDTKTISCAVDYELFESFQEYCKKHRIKQSQLIRPLISQTVLPKD